jgi:hypothetical protein
LSTSPLFLDLKLELKVHVLHKINPAKKISGVDIIENAEEEIEKLEGIPKKETCRLTRSMCLTPVNTKSLLVASGIM